MVGAIPSAPEPELSATISARAADRRNVLLLAIGWLAAVLLIDPHGEFPTTDDWAYLVSVRELVVHGRLYFSDWGASNLLSHILWGSLFALPLGVSYVTLRLSTIVAAFLGAVALYRLLRLIGAQGGLAMLGAGVLLLNPLSVAVSFAYMSDLSFNAAALWSFVLAAEAARRGNNVARVGAWVLGLAALLARQTGIAVPFGWVAGRLAARPRRRLAGYAALIVPILVFLIVQFAFAAVISRTGIAPAAYGRQSNGLFMRALREPWATARLVLQMLPRCFFYFGVLTFPLIAATAPGWFAGRPGRWRGRLIAVAAAAIVLIGLVCWWRTTLFPTWPNTLSMFGIGPDLRGVLTPYWVLVAITALSILGGVPLGMMLVDALWRCARAGEAAANGFSVSAAMAGYGIMLLCAIMLVVARFDRYLIAIMPSVLVLLVTALAGRAVGPKALRAGAVAMVVMALFSIAGVHDFLAAKRVQAQVYAAAVDRIGPRRVDGGWVLNGPTWFRFYSVDSTTALDSWMHADYVIEPAFGPRAGYREIARFPVDRWLPWRRDEGPILFERALVHVPMPDPLSAEPQRRR